MCMLGHTQRVIGAVKAPNNNILCTVPREVIEDVLRYLVAKALAAQHTHIAALKLYIVDNMNPSSVEAMMNIDKRRVIAMKQRLWEKVHTIKNSLKWPVMAEVIKRSYKSIMAIDPVMVRDEPYPVTLHTCSVCGARVATPIQHVIHKHLDMIERIAGEIADSILVNCD